MTLVGKTLGPFRFDAELGSGGMGCVYRGSLTGPLFGMAAGTAVALKTLLPSALATQGALERFHREAQVGGRVDHPNVVRTHGVGTISSGQGDLPVLVMELVDGQTLRALLDEIDRAPEALCRHVGREVAKGLAAIHASGAVHRDIKPENVLVTRDHVVKVMDLGLARLAEATAGLSHSGGFLGSVRYAAPEQFLHAGAPLDARVDLHATGVLLYELATGENPFGGEDADIHAIIRRILHERPRRVGEANPQLSPFFEEVVETLLEKDPCARFESADDLAQVLEQGETGAWWQEWARTLRVRTARPLRRARVSRETPLVGRDAEVERVRALFGGAKVGAGTVLLLEGEDGVGKSRLVDEVVEGLRSEGETFHYLVGAWPSPGMPAHRGGAAVAAFLEHFGSEGLHDSLRPYLASASLRVSAFAAMLRGDAAPTGGPPLGEEGESACFVQVLRALAAEQPTVLVLDDMHLATASGRALFVSLARAVPGHRALLVGTTRPGQDDAWLAEVDRVGRLHRLRIRRLGADDVRALVGRALVSADVAPEIGSLVARASDGNPHFALAIVRALREGRFVSRRPDGAWYVARDLDEFETPGSVRELIRPRLERLDDGERTLLEVAACCGLEFDAALAADVAGVARVPALQRLGSIEKNHRLVRAVGRRFRFDHPQVRDALLEGLPASLREECHAAVALAIEAISAAATHDPRDLDGALCVTLCEHWLLGAQGARAARYLREALAYLEHAHRSEAVVSLARRALEHPGAVGGAERASVSRRLAQHLDRLGRCETARATPKGDGAVGTEPGPGRSPGAKAPRPSSSSR